MGKRRKKASEIFGPVDPHLKVIDGGSRRHKKRDEQSDWERLNGATCPKCGRDAMQFHPQRGVCIFCAREMNEQEDREAKKRERFLKFRKAHNAKIDKHKKVRHC